MSDREDNPRLGRAGMGHDVSCDPPDLHLGRVTCTVDPETARLMFPVRSWGDTVGEAAPYLTAYAGALQDGEAFLVSRRGGGLSIKRFTDPEDMPPSDRCEGQVPDA